MPILEAQKERLRDYVSNLDLFDYSAVYPLVKYEKLAESYEALLHLAMAIIAFKKCGIIYV